MWLSSGIQKQVNGDVWHRGNMIVELTKKEYLGEGYIHQFRNDKTGEIVTVPCSEEEYSALSGHNGHLNNPTMEDHTWIGSCGGTVKVDSKTSLLGENEYCEFKGKYFVSYLDDDGKVKANILSKEDITDDKVSKSKLKEKTWQLQ